MGELIVGRGDKTCDLGLPNKQFNKLYVHEILGDAGNDLAKKTSPAFTGVPTAPTAASGTSTTQLATTKFVVDEIASELEDKVRLKDTSKRDTAYSTEATVTMPGIPVNMFLECTTAGTTDSTVPVIIQPVSEGSTINDGTVVWTVRRAVCESDYPKTSFGASVLNHLLGSTLASLLDAVSTDSLFSKLLKKALEATGLRYSMGTNGYICLGDLFGNLILQWGTQSLINDSRSMPFPIAFTVVSKIVGIVNNNCYLSSSDYWYVTTAGVNFSAYNLSGKYTGSITVDWIAIGY